MVATRKTWYQGQTLMAEDHRHAAASMLAVAIASGLGGH